MNHIPTPRRRAAVQLIVLAALTCVSAAGAQAPARECSGSWSAPEMLRRAGKPVYIERGVVAPFGDGVIALGSPTFHWLAEDHIAPVSLRQDTAQVFWAFSRTGSIVDLAGGSEGVIYVDSLRRRKSPRLAGWSDGSVRVVWSALDSVVATNGEPNRAEIAAFDGQRWSTPEVVGHARLPHELNVPAMRTGVPFDLPGFALDVRDSTGLYVALMLKRNGAWSMHKLLRESSLYHASAVPLRDSGMVVLYSAAVRLPPMTAAGSRTVPTALFATRVRWSGDSALASPPVLIDTLRTTSFVSHFAMAKLGGDSVIATWYQNTGSERSLMTALTADGGISWRVMPALTVSSSVEGARHVVDSRGALHIIYSAAERDDVVGATGAIMHSIWNAGRWGRPTAVSAGDVMALPTPGGTRDGRIVAMWGEAKMIPEGPMPYSMFSVWKPDPSCTPR